MSTRASEADLRTVLLSMGFRERLVALRKQRALTQQALADLSGLNVVQIRRWETAASQPSLDALKKLALGLRTTTDQLLFGDDERGPGDDLRLQFEAVQRLDPDERAAIKTVIEGVITKHEVRRLAS